MKKIKFLITPFILIILSSCSSFFTTPSAVAQTKLVIPSLILTATPIYTATQPATQTPYLSPTATFSEQQAAKASLTALARTDSAKRTPTKSGFPTRTKYPSRTPRPTRTPFPTLIPTDPPPTYTPAPQDAAIRIFSPATFSRLVSPFKISISVIPGKKGDVYLQLIGEGGETLVDKSWIFPYADGRRTNISEDISYTLQTLSETAKLMVFTKDEYGRLMSLATEDLVLMGIGKADLAEPDNLYDPFALLRPFNEQIIKKNTVVINGMTRCRKDCRLFFEVTDINGNSLGSLELQNILHASLDYQPIYYEIPVTKPVSPWVRVILHQQDVYTGEDIAVSSVLVQLMN
jgi:hypothetical protein